jgi:hypothetical protein
MKTFEEELTEKYNHPKCHPTTVHAAGVHEPFKCWKHMFMLVSTCGCMWMECECGYIDNFVMCPAYEAAYNE